MSESSAVAAGMTSAGSTVTAVAEVASGAVIERHEQRIRLAVAIARRRSQRG
ncbi:MAG: hypothetical protein NZ603_01895 [Acidimicrobiales bacterium]|nr:hypothetical protein [Acidimicrobiales bacterium]